MTGFCGNFRLRGGHDEPRSLNALMHVGVYCHRKVQFFRHQSSQQGVHEVVNSINGFSKTLDRGDREEDEGGEDGPRQT